MTSRQENSPLAKKIALYAAAGAAVTAGGVNMAEAEICDSTVTITANTVGETFDFDIDGDGTNDFNISVANSFNGAGAAGSSFFNLAGLGSNLVGIVSTTATYNGVNAYLGNFTSTFGGQSATSAGVMFIRYPGAAGTFYGVGGPFGLQFDIGGETHFGSVSGIEVDAGTNAMTFNFQWEKVAGRNFGVVPEPTSVSLLALGTLGLVARRRRK